MAITVDVNGIQVELKVGPSIRVQKLDGSWVMQRVVTPVIVGPHGGGPGGGEPLPVPRAA